MGIGTARAASRVGGLLLGLLFAGVRAAAADPAADARAIVEGADLVHTATFEYACGPATWERILDNPLLLGAVWRAYGFAPAYRVSGKTDSLHVVDPTGLVGDAVPGGAAAGQRAWVARGRLDHWAVPFFNEGEALFVLEASASGSRLQGRLTVHVRAASAVGRLVLRAGRGLLASHVENRVRCNLADAGRIVADIDADPAAVAQRLDGALAVRFRSVFITDTAGAGR